MESDHRGRLTRFLTSLLVPVSLLLLVSVGGWLTLELGGRGRVPWWAVALALMLTTAAVVYLILIYLSLERHSVADRNTASNSGLSPEFIDSLTGLPSRVWFDHTFRTEIARSRRYRHPLSIVVLDVDHFTRVTRTHGSARADAILTAIAEILRKTVRQTDHLARVADDEFVVVVSETGDAGARNAAEKLRGAIERHEFGSDLQMTVSIGVATVEESDTVESFLRRGEAAAMTARRKGGNGVATATF